MFDQYSTRTQKKDLDKSLIKLKQLENEVLTKDQLLDETKIALEESQKINSDLLKSLSEKQKNQAPVELQEHFQEQEKTITKLQDVINSLKDENDILKSGMSLMNPTQVPKYEGKSDSVKNLVVGLKGTEELIMNLENRVAELEEENQKLFADNSRFLVEIQKRESQNEYLSKENNELKKITKNYDDKNSNQLKKTISDQENEIRGLQAKLAHLSQNLDVKSGDDRFYDEIIGKLSNYVGKKVNVKRLGPNEKEDLIREMLNMLDNTQSQQRTRDVKKVFDSGQVEGSDQASEKPVDEEQSSDEKEYTQVVQEKQINDDGGEVWIYKKKSLKIGDKNKAQTPGESPKNYHGSRGGSRKVAKSYHYQPHHTKGSDLSHLNSELRRLHRDVRRMKDDYFTHPSHA